MPTDTQMDITNDLAEMNFALMGQISKKKIVNFVKCNYTQVHYVQIERIIQNKNKYHIVCIGCYIEYLMKI
jgi:rRNA maturation endonuclease Nob1